jgi:hypothetical protein
MMEKIAGFKAKILRLPVLYIFETMLDLRICFEVFLLK